MRSAFHLVLDRLDDMAAVILVGLLGLHEQGMLELSPAVVTLAGALYGVLRGRLHQSRKKARGK